MPATSVPMSGHSTVDDKSLQLEHHPAQVIARRLSELYSENIIAKTLSAANDCLVDNVSRAPWDMRRTVPS
jgi:hypothetical protein